MGGANYEAGTGRPRGSNTEDPLPQVPIWGSRLGATPALGHTQLRQGRAQVARQKLGQRTMQHELTSTLTLQGLSAGCPQAVLQQMMAHVGNLMKLPLQRSDGQATLTPIEAGIVVLELDGVAYPYNLQRDAMRLSESFLKLRGRSASQVDRPSQ